MKSLCEKQKELSLGDVVGIWGLLLAVVSFLCDLILQGVFDNELPRFLFSFFFFGLLVVGGVMSIFACKKLKRQRNSYERQRDEFIESHNGDGDGYCAVRMKEIKAEKQFQDSRRKICIVKGLQILAVLILVVILCLRNPINSLALWNAVFVGDGEIEESDMEPEPEPEPTAAEVVEAESSSADPEDGRTVAEELRILKPLIFKFVLEEPDRKPTFDIDIESAVFFLDKKADQTLEEYIDVVIEEISACQRVGTDIRTLQDGDGHTFYTYTEAENAFKKKEKTCQKEKYYNVWVGKAPTSAELDCYMEGRKKLNLAKQDGKQSNPELWWKLANDNQHYALEYEVQTQNGDAVLYYYMMSIFCAREALKYDIPEEQSRQIYHYMVMRYHDIRGMTLEIPLVYKELAGDIYRCLAKSDEMLESEKEETGFETDDAV